LAFIIVFLLGLLILKTSDITWLMFLAVYGIDSVLTILQRLYLRENIFRPHRKHLYQLLANEKQIPHIVVSSIYMTVQAIIMIGLLFFMTYGNFAVGIYSTIILLTLTTIYQVIKNWVEK
jgi:phosphatidylglycerophosphate synthase